MKAGKEIPFPFLVGPPTKGSGMFEGAGGADGSSVCSGAALLLARDGREVQRRGGVSWIQFYESVRMLGGKKGSDE